MDTYTSGSYADLLGSAGQALGMIQAQMATSIMPNYAYAYQNIPTYPTPSRIKKFMRVNDEIGIYESEKWEQPLDELRCSVSEWLGKA